jgi:hypothetical protein
MTNLQEPNDPVLKARLSSYHGDRIWQAFLDNGGVKPDCSKCGEHLWPACIEVFADNTIKTFQCRKCANVEQFSESRLS